MTWLALVGAPPPFTPEKTALHTKSAQTAGFLAIWCEVPRKILRNTPRLVDLPVLEGIDCVSDVSDVDQAPQNVVVEVDEDVLATLVHGLA
ncbi:hypothetical protein CIP107555_01770 [Corynebacterium diphtheriae]|nr:hypothetical protein CIP107555_01770 [Corynebacterium diphtheriae]